MYKVEHIEFGLPLQLQKFWLYLNNNKTALCSVGAGLAWASSIWTGPVGIGLSRAFAGLGGLSLAHKAVKGVNRAKAKQKNGERVWWLDIIVLILEYIFKKKGG